MTLKPKKLDAKGLKYDTFGGPDVHCFNKDLEVQTSKLISQIDN